MLRKAYILTSFLFVVALNTYSQEANFYGAKNESLARATVALSNSWSLFNNPSGLPYHHKELLVGYQNKYVALGIHDGVFGFVFPIHNTVVGIGAMYFGDELLNKSKITGAVAHKIGKTSLGLKATYDQIRIDKLGTKGILLLDIGGQMVISDQVIIGMTITNLNQAKFDTLGISRPATSVQIGVNYHPHNKLIILTQIEKDIYYPTALRIALEYFISPNVSVRTGVLPSPTSAFAGFGFKWQFINLDLVSSYQQPLGWSSGFSIGFTFDQSNEN